MAKIYTDTGHFLFYSKKDSLEFMELKEIEGEKC